VALRDKNSSEKRKAYGNVLIEMDSGVVGLPIDLLIRIVHAVWQYDACLSRFSAGVLGLRGSLPLLLGNLHNRVSISVDPIVNRRFLVSSSKAPSTHPSLPDTWDVERTKFWHLPTVDACGVLDRGARQFVCVQ